MKHAPKPILFAPMQLLKIWADGFGIQLTEAQRYEIGNPHTPYNRYNYLPSEVITDKLDGVVTDSYLNALKQILPLSIQELINNLRQTSFFAMTPEEIENFFWGELYAIEFTQAFYYLHSSETYLPSLLKMMSTDNARHATAVALEVLQQDSSWHVFKSSLDKDAIDRIRSWRTSELASFTKLKELIHSSTLDIASQQKYFTILLHARLLDSLKSKPTQSNKGDQKTPSKLLFEGIRLRHLNSDIRLLLPLEKPRTDVEKQQCLWGYDLLEMWHQAKNDYEKGLIKSACVRCSKLLDLNVCFGPEEQEAVTHFALMIGSMKGNNGDAPLLKKAKNIGIIYGLEQPHEHISERPKAPLTQLNKFVKQYEIEQWRRDCKKLLPTVNVDYSKVRPAMIIVNSEERKLTVASRKSRIGDSALRLEQLSQAIQSRDYAKVDELLAQSSRLDFGTHERGYSPLIIALQNYRDTTSREDAEVILALLLKFKDNSTGVNTIVSTRTDKLKLTPLGLAIECNRLDFVEKLLALGAPVNQRLTEQFKTPLMHALNNFAKHKSLSSQDQVAASKEIIKLLLNHNADPNLAHDSPGAEYHVGHYAAELNDVEIFDWLVKKGLDLEQAYYDPITERLVQVEHVAHCWRANHIIEYLQS